MVLHVRKGICILVSIARRSWLFTWLLGKSYPVNSNRIEILLTFACDFNCIDCCIMCRQAPSMQRMSIGQIKRFIRESIAQDRKWEAIRVLGGEPTLHPDLIEILRLLLEYKFKFSPKTIVELCTNGFSDNCKKVLSQLPEGIIVDNSAKTSQQQSHHIAINFAPVDDPVCVFADYSNACWVTKTMGIGLSVNGYYQCSVAPAIDRIFGFDLGKKGLPLENDTMTGMCRRLCRFCGHFRLFDKVKPGYVSPTWKRAFEEYSKAKRALTIYDNH